MLLLNPDTETRSLQALTASVPRSRRRAQSNSSTVSLRQFSRQCPCETAATSSRARRPSRRELLRSACSQRESPSPLPTPLPFPIQRKPAPENHPPVRSSPSEFHHH